MSQSTPLNGNGNMAEPIVNEPVTPFAPMRGPPGFSFAAYRPSPLLMSALVKARKVIAQADITRMVFTPQSEGNPAVGGEPDDGVLPRQHANAPSTDSRDDVRVSGGEQRRRFTTRNVRDPRMDLAETGTGLGGEQ